MRPGKLLILSLAFFVAFAPVSRAASIGSAAITVGVATAAGAVLGASTLPFYGEPGKHTKNIFYGAAIGAVAGVILAAYSGVKEGAPEEDGASLRRELRRQDLLAQDRLRYQPETSGASRGGPSPAAVLAWSPLAQFQF